MTRLRSIFLEHFFDQVASFFAQVLYGYSLQLRFASSALMPTDSAKAAIGDYKRVTLLYWPERNTGRKFQTKLISVNPAPPHTALASKPSTELNPSKVGDILWQSAWSALVLAFLAQLFGSIVVSVVGWVWHDMIPSMPPGMERKPHLEAQPGDWDFSWFQQHRFALLFAVFFLVESIARLVGHSGSKRQRKVAAVVRRLQRRVSAEWFTVLIVNAFTAFAAVLVIQITQQFTWTALVWSVVGDAIQSLAQMVASALPGGGLLRQLGAFFSWYQENQFKFLFWFLYAAGICDDLGLPNFKTLARYLWRRWQRRHSRPAEKPAAS